ncbi:MAG: exosortase H-associated membrane protein, partial [Thiohalocapsa sp.]
MIPSKISRVTRFAVTVLFWLPLCFAVWYFLSILFVAPIASILDAVMTTSWPSLIVQVEQDGNRLLVTLQVVLQQSAQSEPRTALVKFHAHPLDYCYGIALYSALVLASTRQARRRLIKWIVGLLLLFVIAMMGITAQMIEVIIFQSLPQVGAPVDWSPIAYNTAAIAYKMTYLVLTPVAPIA